MMKKQTGEIFHALMKNALENGIIRPEDLAEWKNEQTKDW